MIFPGEYDTAHNEHFIGEVYDPILGKGNMYVRQDETETDVIHIRTEWLFEHYPDLPIHNWGTNER